MMLLDSNIIIYAAQTQHANLRHLIARNSPAVSVVSYVEVLGFHGLSAEDRAHFQAFFAAATMFPIDQDVLDGAVRLRQMRRINLGDSHIAATCLSRVLTLVTRNISDFAWIPDLSTFNPFDTV